MSQASVDKAMHDKRDRLSRILGVEWLGQTVASLCWIASVFAYGIDSVGDWLQLRLVVCGKLGDYR